MSNPGVKDILFYPDTRVYLTGTQPFFTPRTAVLLRQITLSGSIHGACDRIGLSYSKGRAMIRTLEGELGYTIVERKKGGPGGGTSCLTTAGIRLLESYTFLEEKIRKYALSQFAPLLDVLGAPE